MCQTINLATSCRNDKLSEISYVTHVSESVATSHMWVGSLSRVQPLANLETRRVLLHPAPVRGASPVLQHTSGIA
jgi:hypothetical protein